MDQFKVELKDQINLGQNIPASHQTADKNQAIQRSPTYNYY